MDGEVRLTAVEHGYPRRGYAYVSCSVLEWGVPGGALPLLIIHTTPMRRKLVFISVWDML